MAIIDSLFFVINKIKKLALRETIIFSKTNITQNFVKLLILKYQQNFY